MKQKLIDKQFAFAGGSFIGHAHSMPGQPGATNNQDSYMWRHGEYCSFAVVSDGCSSSENSEVGAKLLTRILSKTVVTLADERLERNPDASVGADPEFWKRVEMLLLNDIVSIARMTDNSLSVAVNDFWLCTIVGVLITSASTYVVAVGDGTYVVNGQVYHLKPEGVNHPTYIAYQITGTSLTLTNPDVIHLRVHKAFDTEKVEHVLLATDGIDYFIKHENSFLPGTTELVGKLDQFWEGSRFFENPNNVRKRLALVAQDTVALNGRVIPGLLKDDTTVVVIQRRPELTTQTSENAPA